MNLPDDRRLDAHASGELPLEENSPPRGRPLSAWFGLILVACLVLIAGAVIVPTAGKLPAMKHYLSLR